ncbi:MAG: aromatic amino acid lyase, partial [Rhizobacter sp.]|nr:aromatic amino acid lyase [Chlorobiales bacterium]
MPRILKLTGETLSLSSIKDAVRERSYLALAPAAKKKILSSRKAVDTLSESDAPHYGINTGFGILASKKIPQKDLETLQENLILSHAVGTGSLVDDEIVRLMMLTKINALAKGYSGISLDAVNLLIEFFNRGMTPVVYSQGSVGASGDLAPLAHLVLPLMGQGEVNMNGKTLSARIALKHAGLQPHRLRSKEGLALINGTQFMLAYAVHALIRADVMMKTADIVAAMTLEAMRGSASPFDARIAAVRPHKGHKAVAENMRRLIAGSEIMHSHENCQKVQDPYSLRCVPQVHGAVRDAIRHARNVVETETASVTDNPVV